MRFGIGIIFLFVGPTLVIGGGLALRRSSIAVAPPPVMLKIGEVQLRFAPAYLRQGASGEPDRVELLALAPDFIPVARPKSLPSPSEADQSGRDQVFLTLTPAANLASGAAPELSPADRYGRFLAADAQMGEGGLLRRSFEANSPFAGEELYLAPPDGRAFFARCRHAPSPADGLPETCLSQLHVEGLDVLLRFSPALLADWENLRAKAVSLVLSGIVAP
jgi:hypothetical protein